MKLKRLYALFLFISRSLSLIFCVALEGWGGTGGQGWQTAKSTVVLFSCNIRRGGGGGKRKAAFTVHEAAESFHHKSLFSMSALRYLAYHFIICGLAMLFYFWSMLWENSYFRLIWEIREMGVKIKQKGKDVSFFFPLFQCLMTLGKDIPRTSHGLKVIIENTDA